MSQVRVGTHASAKHQFFAFLYHMAKEANITFLEGETRVSIDDVDVERITDIDWEPLKALFPFSRYVDMTERNLDLAATPDDISPQVYQGLRSLNLFCFTGYLKLGLEWGPEYEMAMAAEGFDFIAKSIKAYGDYVISKRIVFLKFENGQSICSQLVNVSLKPQAPVKPFPSGCGWLICEKFMKIGIYAVILKFNTIPNPHDCVVYTKAGLDSLPVSTAQQNLIGSAESGERCMITRYDSLVEEVQELAFDLELE